MVRRWNRFLVWLGRWLAHPILWWFLLHRRTRYGACWLFFCVLAGATLYTAWHIYDTGPLPAGRPDGNSGHCTIDFGGQYLMGRMLHRGLGRHLYHRNHLRTVLAEVYPRADESSEATGSDAENLMAWVMGTDDPEAGNTIASFAAPLAAVGPWSGSALSASAADLWTPDRLDRLGETRVGGPLYPPINAFFYYPLAGSSPRTGYRLNQTLALFWTLLAGLAIRQCAEGRIWWPIASSVVLLFPGYFGSICLGQNATLTLAVLAWGWALLSEERPWAGGMVWGLLSFKPVWAMAFFLVPLVSGRWRVCLAMLATGATLALLTLPVVGVQAWFDWLHVGREATDVYLTDRNWIELSRDLLGAPRRWLDWNASADDNRRNVPLAVIGWSLLLSAFALTLTVAYLRRRQIRQVRGPGAAFLLLGSWVTCYHFMYYDVLLSALPYSLLFTEPRRCLVRRYLVFSVVPEGFWGADGDYFRPTLPRSWPRLPSAAPIGPWRLWVLNPLTPVLVLLLPLTAYVFPEIGLNSREFPWETLSVVLVWLWCGAVWLWQGETKGNKVEHSPGPASPELASGNGELAAGPATLRTGAA